MNLQERLRQAAISCRRAAGDESRYRVRMSGQQAVFVAEHLDEAIAYIDKLEAELERAEAVVGLAERLEYLGWALHPKSALATNIHDALAAYRNVSGTPK